MFSSLTSTPAYSWSSREMILPTLPLLGSSQDDSCHGTKDLVKESEIIVPSLLKKKEAQLTTSSGSTTTPIWRVMPSPTDLWQLLTEKFLIEV
jgi:hypothetical protein